MASLGHIEAWGHVYVSYMFRVMTSASSHHPKQWWFLVNDGTLGVKFNGICFQMQQYSVIIFGNATFKDVDHLFNVFTHCGLMAPYGDIELGQLCLKQWLDAWRHQGIA